MCTLLLSLNTERMRKTQLEILKMNAYAMENLGIDPNNQLPILAPVWGNNTFYEEFQDFMLSTILSDYGKPDQVMLRVSPDDPDRPDLKWHPFTIVLVYLQKGIFVEYVAPREKEGHNFFACSNNFHVNIAVWDAKNNLPLDYIFRQGAVETTLSNSRPINDVTSYSIEEFHRNFSVSDKIKCIYTPAEYWIVP